MTVEHAVIVALAVTTVTGHTWAALRLRDMRRMVGATRQRVHQHHRALVHLQGLTAPQAVSAGQPMATVTRMRPPSVLAPEPAPAAVSEIEQALAARGRLTRIELARHLDRKPWEILGDLKQLMLERRVQLTESHTAGEPAYALADPTLRMTPEAVTR